MKSFDTKSLNFTPLLNNVSAMFFTPTFDCAIIQQGTLRSTHVAAAAAMVVVFPVPGGPVKLENHGRVIRVQNTIDKVIENTVDDY